MNYLNLLSLTEGGKDLLMYKALSLWILHQSSTYFLVVLIGVLFASILVFSIFFKKYHSQKNSIILLAQSNEQLLINIKHLQEESVRIGTSEQMLKNNTVTKDKFFSIIAHDLKGPLNSLTGLLQILIKYADSFSKVELKDFGKNMNKSVNNLLDLLENLFHWSQTQSGTIEYRPEETELLELVQKNVNLLEPAAANKNISISVNVKEGIMVLADSHMISFTIRNLISNAIKFTHNGGNVTIFSQIYKDSAELSVVDNGVGMSTQEIEKLFRIDKCYTTNGTANEIGTGLGLILCNEFIEKNGGKIAVESEVNKGSTFRFTLPVVAVAENLQVANVC